MDWCSNSNRSNRRNGRIDEITNELNDLLDQIVNTEPSTEIRMGKRERNGSQKGGKRGKKKRGDNKQSKLTTISVSCFSDSSARTEVKTTTENIPDSETTSANLATTTSAYQPSEPESITLTDHTSSIRFPGSRIPCSTVSISCRRRVCRVMGRSR